jgi:hypothetical protein
MSVISNGSFSRSGFGADSSIHPRFFIDSIQDQAASEIQGRPIFKDVERVEIIIPGNPHTRPVMAVTQEHTQRWPKEYEAFKSGMEVSPEGTPLEEWAILKRSQVLELKALGFKTVEHIARMDDQAIQRIGMGGRILRDRAKAFLDDAENIAQNSRLSADNERLMSEMAALRRQVEEMGMIARDASAQVRALKDEPSPILTHIPGMNDPVEKAKAAPVEIAGSSLDNLTSRRGRKPMPRDEAGNIIRDKVA